MGIQMMGGNPMDSFQTGYNLGNKPNAIGTAILGVMDRYQQKQAMDEQLGQKKALAQWELENITKPTKTFEAGLSPKEWKPRSMEEALNFERQKDTPDEYSPDLNSAVEAIKKGANKIEVFQRIASKYPKKSAELKRIIMADDKMTMEDIMANINALQK